MSLHGGGNGKSESKKWTEIGPLRALCVPSAHQGVGTPAQAVGTIESFYTSDISDLWFGEISVVASMKARYGRYQCPGRDQLRDCGHHPGKAG